MGYDVGPGFEQRALEERLFERRDRVLEIARSHGAEHVRVFGSVASGTADAESDIDLLVQMQPGSSLLDLISLTIELEELLGAEVDVVTEGGLHPVIRRQVLETARTL
jgi:predicted nucleotidyltransferase